MVGRDTPLFSRQAVSEVHRLAKGYPRLVNIVCDHALLYGYGADLERIDIDTVRDCSRDLSVALDLEELPGKDELIASVDGLIATRKEPKVTAERSRRPAVLFGVTLAAAAVAVALFLFYHYYR